MRWLSKIVLFCVIGANSIFAQKFSPVVSSQDYTALRKHIRPDSTFDVPFYWNDFILPGKMHFEPETDSPNIFRIYYPDTTGGIYGYNFVVNLDLIPGPVVYPDSIPLLRKAHSAHYYNKSGFLETIVFFDTHFQADGIHKQIVCTHRFSYFLNRKKKEVMLLETEQPGKSDSLNYQEYLYEKGVLVRYRNYNNYAADTLVYTFIFRPEIFTKSKARHYQTGDTLLPFPLMEIQRYRILTCADNPDKKELKKQRLAGVVFATSSYEDWDDNVDSAWAKKELHFYTYNIIAELRDTFEVVCDDIIFNSDESQSPSLMEYWLEKQNILYGNQTITLRDGSCENTDDYYGNSHLYEYDIHFQSIYNSFCAHSPWEWLEGNPITYNGIWTTSWWNRAMIGLEYKRCGR